MITLMSWGNKYGNPPANFKFDVSYFQNPWRDESIRNEKDSGIRRKMIFDFMEKQEGVIPFIERVSSLVRLLHLLHKDENLQIAFCCSAGEYRSPVMVELLAEELKSYGILSIIKPSLESKI